MRVLSIILFFVLASAAGYTWFVVRKPPPSLEMTEPLRIHQGVIRGGIDAENPAIRVYNGLPYASASRWSAPVAPPQWGAMERDARHFGAECLQSRSRYAAFVSRITEGLGLPWWERLAAGIVVRNQAAPAESEDCLYLNVRTGNAGGRSLQPVMVWIHGGAHQYGSGSQALYQANGLVERGVVLVTINYRLGPFGYLAHPALTEEAGTSGNYGLLDQIAALKWIRENIASFGGDPENVTLFGESAGAQSITELMATPRAAGLFHKVILQSGASTGSTLHLTSSYVQGQRSAQDAGSEFLSSLVSPKADAAELRALPARAMITRAEARNDLTGYFRPVVDGEILPKPIGAAFRDGSVPRVPMIAGYNADEGTLFYDLIQSPTLRQPSITGSLEQREALLAETFGPNAAKALQALYGMKDIAGWDRGAVQMLGDDLFGVHMRFVGKTNAEAGAPTFLYMFSRKPPSARQTLGAFHAAEIPFVFGSSLPLLRRNAPDEELSVQMMAYWTNFARSGDPNGAGLPGWPNYSVVADAWLEFDVPVRVVAGLRARQLNILEEALLKLIAQVAGPPPPVTDLALNQAPVSNSE